MKLRGRGKTAFLDSLAPQPTVLDVGCGNESPRRFKARRPDCYYVGIDVGDYNQNESQRYADEYIITTPETFAAQIQALGSRFDAVVSSHNLEHCNAPQEVLRAMASALKPGGALYLAFPCEQSVRFPRRQGTLNFHDDASHRTVPDWKGVLEAIRRAGLIVDFSTQRYRPLAMALIGLVVEPLSAATGKVMRGTWDLYGFESVIWASRPRQ